MQNLYSSVVRLMQGHRPRSAGLLRPTKPSLPERRLQALEARYEARGKECPICGRWKMNLARHTMTHTGNPFPIVVRGLSTFNKSKADDLRSRDKGLAESHDPVILELVRTMLASTPAPVRHYGGTFLRGELAGQTVEGLTKYFTKSGRIKQSYVDLFAENRSTSTTTPLNLRPKRKCNIAAASPHANLSWDRAPPSERYGTILTNLYNQGKFEGWKDSTGSLVIQDPTLIIRGPKHCSLCHNQKGSCKCLEVKVKRVRPKIVDMGNGMGEGVQATRTYDKGELLGELVGELAPLDTYSDGWAAELVRDDLLPPGKPIPWCLVYPRYVGNWVRKVNHSCEPNCVFESMPISGRWRVMLKAIKRIERGSWIWVDYGARYWQSPGGRCLCLSENCVSNSIANS